ncbi:related to Endo-1,4-beta-xylanase A [Ramularia collo-cygni]|uniref:Beta-xylanase n=1 Tax=Ramularia collo-cygni TaxID=112498 RepID=A0A2D3VDK6_9PEZI|nr:related to Endo-1,4-beta-xylanase A [Ramularia collo-cygni]CZT20884.1 related to Endo-1,4-beta-xylanase A [Ramularia collo-cygni]
MHFTHALLAISALAGLTSATPIDSLDKRQSQGLAQAFLAKGRKFLGTAVTFRNDAAESAIYGNKNDFNSITPENAMKWASIQPSQGQFNWAGADQYADYARRNGYQLHCHTLVWHSQLPAWVSGRTWSRAELTAVMKAHIDAVAGRYKDVCTRWDVVNEALNEDGSTRDSVFRRTFGDDFIPLAFQLAKAAAPNAQLYYNDYNLETSASKAGGARRFVNLIKAAGQTIHGVGLQCHLSITYNPTYASMVQTLTGFTNLGVDVAYTEIDVKMTLPSNSAKLETQRQVYQNVARSCVAVPRCVGMTIWGVSDKYSWIPGVNPAEGAAALYNENMQAKPARAGFLSGITG